MKKMIALPLLAVLSATAFAADGETAAANATTVTLDKETGQFRAPTAEERAALEADAARLAAEAAAAPSPRFPVKSAPKSEVEAAASQKTYANGTVRMQVPQNLYSSVEATVGANGEVQVQHAGQHQEADHE